MHLWPPPTSGVVIQNGSGCDYSVLAPLCPPCRTCALGECHYWEDGGSAGRRVSALASSLISSAAYLHERLSGVCDCWRACVCLSGHSRKLRLHFCNFQWSAIGLSWRGDVFPSSWLAPCLAVFCLLEIVFSSNGARMWSIICWEENVHTNNWQHRPVVKDVVLLWLILKSGKGI